MCGCWIKRRCLFMLALCLFSISLTYAGDLPTCPLVPPGTVFGNSWEDPETCPEPCPVNAQIQAVRDAADGSGQSLPINCAYVTHIRPFFSGLDAGGFFLQGYGPDGPAIFALIQPNQFEPALQVGDVVSLTVTETLTLRDFHYIIAVSDLVVEGRGQPITPFIQEVTNNTDLVSNLDNYESELISLTGTITGPFGFAGDPFQAAQVSTLGIAGDPDLVMRIPVAVKDALSVAENCDFYLPGSPMFRFFGQAQLSAWEEKDIRLLSCPAPRVLSAIALTANSVQVNFDRVIDPASVLPDGSQFTFDNGLTATAAVADGDSVVVTTSSQVGGLQYVATVASSVTDTLGSGVDNTANSTEFPGFAPAAVLRINEVNANIAAGCDLVELRVMTGGAMGGISLWERTSSVLTFSNFSVAAGDIIVVHFDTADTNCNGSASTDETVSTAEQPNASHPQNYDSAFDWYSTDAGITATDNVLTLYDQLQNIIDAVLVSDDTTGTAAALSEAQAAVVAAAGEWQIVGGGVPEGGFVDDNFNAHAVQDLNGTTNTAAGTSIQRNSDADNNDKSDWTMTTDSWGVINSGQLN